jgi:hypothetical protein
MRSRWLVVVVIASLCLNVAVVGAYFLCRTRHDRPRRLPPEVREKLRQAREAALPGFTALAEKEHAGDSLLWAEMSSDNPDSLRVDSLSSEVGRLHGRMRAMVFWQMRRELQMMPAGARAEYLNHIMRMRPGFGRPGRAMGRRMRRDAMMPPPEGEPPPPESGD